MRPTRRSRMLGIALGERQALVAEVSSAGGRAVVERVGDFVYPQGTTLAEPDALGRALGQFLADRQFSTRVAVVGIPGKWLLTKRVDAPPAESPLVSETLRLQAEGEFGGDGGEFLYDYAGEASTAQPRPVLLMAAPKRQMDQVAEVMSAARVRAAAVVPFAATLAARAAKDARVLLFGPGGAEFVSQNGSHPRALRYLGPSTSPTPFLASELRRASTGAAMGAAGELALHARSTNGTPAGELLVWNDVGLEPAAMAALGESLGAPVKLGDLRTLGATQAAGAGEASGYGAAVALAMAGMEPAARGARGGLPVDFLHSRLAPVRQVRFERRTVLLSVAGAVVLLLSAAAVINLRSQRADVTAMQQQVATAAPALKAAKATVEKVEYAQAWQSTDPRFVACLHDLTKAMPEDGQTFLTSFNLNEELKGGFAGKAKSDLDVLALLDRLNASGRFSDIKAWYDAPRGKVEAAPKAPPQQPPPQQPPQMPPQMPPTMPGQPMPGQPTQPGVVFDPDANMPGGSVGPMAAVAVPSGGAPVMVAQGPTPTPGPGSLQAAAAAAAQARAAARAGRGGASPGGPGEPSGPGGPGGARAAQAPAGEVTFSMTFNYVPAKKG